MDTHNCMHGGQRQKWTRFVTNVPGLEGTLDLECKGKKLCDRNGQCHLEWTPRVDERGNVVEYKTSGEAEYPVEMCNVLGRAIADLAEKDDSGRFVLDFVEIFSGPNAPLSAAVKGALENRSLPNPREVTRTEAKGAGRSGAVKVSIPTLKESRERENEECVGGLRSAWKSVTKIPKARPLGVRLRKVIEEFIDERPHVLEAGLAHVDFEGTREEDLQVLRERIARVINAKGNLASPLRTPWQAGLLDAYVREAEDPETELPRWLSNAGVPAGIVVPIKACGIFPRVATEAKAQAELEGLLVREEPPRNYKSFQEAKEHAQPELQRLVQNKFVTLYKNWKDVLRRFGSTVASKLAAIVKTRKDGSVKCRLVIDFRRSMVNGFVKATERVVLPRIRDVLADVVWLMRNVEADEEVELMVADFQDAFHTLPVAEAEKKFQTARTYDGQFLGFETIVFGGMASPLVWGAERVRSSCGQARRSSTLSSSRSSATWTTRSSPPRAIATSEPGGSPYSSCGGKRWDHASRGRRS